MIDISLPTFDDCRGWINNARSKGMEWERIEYGGRSTDEELAVFLENQKEMNFWAPELNIDLWKEIVETKRKAEIEAEEIESKAGSSVLVGNDTELDVYVPMDEKSSWQLYRKSLLDAGWKETAVNEIEKATLATLRKLNRDTTETGPVKGLVIGHVQSGKTANMAALMAMAADWKWNFFVVLSGTIENLRKQTQKRLMNDLNRDGNIAWDGGLEHLSRQSPVGQRMQDLLLEESSRKRYFTVCLKNSTRLKKLIEWMQRDPNKYQKLKMIVIDDEADQASVDSSSVKSVERARINQLIMNLVNGKKPNNDDFPYKVKAMNYISYTATPYANVLNESGEESLYPKDFIRTLSASNEYFGPKQIFGVDGTDHPDGLDILRDVSDDDLEEIYAIHRGEHFQIPQSLKDSITWFFCAAAAMRVYHYKKPVSMLIHTSQKQQHHSHISEAITDWIQGISKDKSAFLMQCKKIWKTEKERFSIQDFRSGYEDYGRSDSEIPAYPSFDDLVPHIRMLLSEVSPIPLDEESGEELRYHAGTHLCIDNCANNGVNEDGMHMRLAYPDPPYPEPAPAFIVIGGSTLSRGLTIEGLVSTYFLRGSCQADSLMQMGRWFGYRKGYELLPRIWMHDDTVKKFRFLAELEHEMRDDLVQYMYAGASPSDFGPRIKNTPQLSWMRITSKNKMKGAEEVEMDFTGASTQTVVFRDDKDLLQQNIDTTESFLWGMGEGKPSVFNKNSLVWRDVEFSYIYENLLSRFNFHERSKVFNDMESFSGWMHSVSESGDLSNWNIVVSGLGYVDDDGKEKGWILPGGNVGMVNRSKKKNITGEKDLINIGVLRAPMDLYADIEDKEIKEEIRSSSGKTKENKDVHQIRDKAGLGKTPQLLIYRINRCSKARTPEDKATKRENLNASCDIIGICMLIPGVRKGVNLARRLTVKIENMPEEQKDDRREE